MPQASPQDCFNTLLAFIKSKPLNWLAVPWHVPSLATKEGQDKFLQFKPTMIQVMESGIFYNGGLKGWLLSGNHYESYPILDLAQFIHDLSHLLFKYETMTEEYPTEFQAHAFSEGMRHLITQSI